MAAGDKNKNQKRSDFAKHFSEVSAGMPICKNTRYGYSTNNISDVDCKNCLSILKGNSKII